MAFHWERNLTGDGTASLIRIVIHQKLDLWTGEIVSHFTVDRQPITVKTVCDQQKDEIAVQVQTPLLEEGRETAKRQGYQGIRWPEKTDPSGRESPSPIGPFLIWLHDPFPVLIPTQNTRLIILPC